MPRSDAISGAPSNMQGSTFIDQFEFKAIDEMDPSLKDGHRVVYDRECPLEMRIQSGSNTQDVGTLEGIRIKMLMMGDEGCPEHLRIELTSENDIFFHYTHSLDESVFKVMQENQKLMIEFSDYASCVIRQLNNCIKEPESYLAIFLMHRDGNARLDFIQNMEYKFVELLSCDFIASPDDVVKNQIMYRYNAAKSKCALMQTRLNDISALVKVKNPSLLLQLQKQPPKIQQPGGSVYGSEAARNLSNSRSTFIHANQ